MRKRRAVEEEPEHETPEETGKALKDELEKQDAPPPRRPFTFGNVNKSKEVNLDPEFDKIVESVFVEHPFAEYQRLEKGLKVGTTRNDHGSLMKALDHAETNARMAHKLWMTARVERERWEKENAVVFSAMRIEATKTLQHEKDQKIRNKMITEADIESMCAALYSEQWVAQETKRRKVKAMEDSMSNLNELWLQRCKTLNVMLSKQR